MALEMAYYESWVERAACRSTGDAFFPEYGASHEEWDYIRSLCKNSCPVLADCRDWIMRTELGNDHKTRFGVAAGMSPLERRKYESQWLADQEGAA